MTTSNFDPNRVLLTGENPFIRLSQTDDGPVTTEASLWRIIFSPYGPGHVLFLRSELTDDEIQVYSDNIAMTRWLQATVQGSITPAFGDQDLPVIEAEFPRPRGHVYDFWTETVTTPDEDISLTWYNLGEPLLLHTQPNAAEGRPYGVNTLFLPAEGARLTLDGVQAAGRPWPRERDGRAFSTCALAFSESWTEAR